jgi:hypothetical protein
MTASPATLAFDGRPIDARGRVLVERLGQGPLRWWPAA